MDFVPVIRTTTTHAPATVQSHVIPSRAALLVRDLDRVWWDLLNNGLAKSTLTQYSGSQVRFIRFCAVVKEPPCPASEVLLLRFVAANASRVSANTIQSYLSAVRYLHIISGFANPIPEFERLRLVMRALKKLSAPPRKRSPVSIDMLRIIASHLDFSKFNDTMFWAATCVGFFGFLRVSEFTTDGLFDPVTDLRLEDLSFIHDLSGAVLQIKSSKTDPFRKGAAVTVGRTGETACPVSALLTYLGRRSTAPGPLFRFANGRALSKAWFCARLKLECEATGVGGDFTSHSLRIGAATAASAAGLSNIMIQTLGRWSSDAFKLYVRTPRGVLAKASRRICVGG